MNPIDSPVKQENDKNMNPTDSPVKQENDKNLFLIMSPLVIVMLNLFQHLNV